MSFGLYIHVPFCRAKCPYCDFYSVRFTPEVNREYMDALLREVEGRAAQAETRPLESVFLGGGTPSLLAVENIRRLLAAVRKAFGSEPAEVTMECNPGTLTRDYLRGVRDAGVNRISLGIQSLDSSILQTLGRAHTLEEGITAFHAARDAGFDNISLDLIFGVPGQTMEGWSETLRGVIGLEPEHVSVYELTLDEGTPMGRALTSGKISLPGEPVLEQMYGQAVLLLEDAGLEQYEISNFSRPGARCRHNLNCWEYGDYIGLGPSAHSFIKGRRFWNVGDIDRYNRSVRKSGTGEEGGEDLSPQDQAFEKAMLGLRMRQGLRISSVPEPMRATIRQLSEIGLLARHGERVCLTARGIRVSNEVFLRLR